jgi:3'-phosphoadenosine 5'-phosphosulfate (PAPS) 3'-phosphatase
MINLKEIQEEVKKLLIGKIKEIIINARNGSYDVVEEKSDGDSATVADIEISKILNQELPLLVSNSIVLEEESFNFKVYERIKSAEYIWVVDPIDGTKAFRTKGNNEYCVAIALLQRGNPILSSVYAPEYVVDGNNGCLFEARDDENGAYLNGKLISYMTTTNANYIKCINHIHRDTELNADEMRISNIFGVSEKIRAFEGHSTLVHYCLTIIDDQSKVFTRREANLWDVVQSAYIVKKAGGVVMYKNGESILPVNYDILTFKEDGNKLLFPFNIACPKEYKDLILSNVR